MSIQEKIQSLKLVSFPMLKRAVKILMSLDDESFPKEIKQLMNENDAESTVFRDKVHSIMQTTQSLTELMTKTLTMCCVKYLGNNLTVFTIYDFLHSDSVCTQYEFFYLHEYLLIQRFWGFLYWEM